jgi:hypothetical protein
MARSRLAGIAYPDRAHLHPEQGGRALHRAELARPSQCTESLKERHLFHARSDARAQAYPTRPVHIIVGAAPSGTYDIMARLIGQWLSDRLGQPFVIENRPSAGTVYSVTGGRGH